MPTLPEQPSQPQRVCTVCGVPKPREDYYVKDKRTGRLYSWCKSCHKDKTMAWQRDNRDVVNEIARRSSVKNAEAIRTRNAAYYERNAESIKEWHRERNKRPDVKAKRAAQQAASQGRKAYNAEYREEHKAERAAYNAAYYRKNKEKVTSRIKACTAKNPEKYLAIRSRWKAENKDAVNASTHKRRARLKHNGGEWTEDDWQRLKARFDWRCLGCGKQEMTDGVTLCFDHIIPLSMGGFNIIENAQVLCRSCNSLKHAKMMDLRDRSYPFKKGK